MQRKIERKEAVDTALARGMDTQAMIPIGAALFEIISMLFLPWFSVPDLKYTVYPHTASLLKLKGLQDGIGGQYQVPKSVTAVADKTALYLQAGAWVGAILALIFILYAFRRKVKAAWLGKIVFAWNGLLPIAAFLWAADTNSMLNLLNRKKNTFLNLSIYSHMQMTAYAYAQIIIGVILFFTVRNLLDTKKEYAAEFYITHSSKEDHRLSKRTVICFVLVLTAIPAVIFFGIFFLNDRSPYFIPLCVIIISMLPFFMVFENRRPQAREVVVIAVMASLGVVGRMAFFMVPFFKPTAAIVIISGISLGGEAGFLTGALAGFVSNFFFGQGPWTPWQMFAYGIIGFLAGLMFRRKRGRWKHFMLWVCIYGFLSVLVIYGLLLDTSSTFMGMGEINTGAFLAMYASGFPVNMVHASSTLIFLSILGKPMLKKLDRIKEKYGILEP